MRHGYRQLLIWIACVGPALCGCGSTHTDDNIYNPDESERISAALFAEADQLYLQEEYVAANEKYEKGLSVSPLSPKGEQVINRQYEMGRKLMYAEKEGPLGLPFPKWFSSEAAGLDILKDIAARSAVAAEKKAEGVVGPRSFPVMEDAQWTLATHHYSNADYETALEHFDAIVKYFPDGQWTIKANWFAAECYYRQNEGPEYDVQILDESLRRFRGFIERYPFPIATREDVQLAEARIATMMNRKAAKNYITAVHYAEREHLKAAQAYCEVVLAQYGQTDWAPQATQLLSKVKIALKKRSEVE